MQHTIVRHAHGVALAVGVLAALALVLEVAGGGTGLHGLTGVLVVVGLAGGAALFVELQFPTPTIDMRVDYLRPAIAGKALVADARVKSLGRTVAFVDIEVRDEDDRLVAAGRATYSVKDRELGPRGFPIG